LTDANYFCRAYIDVVMSMAIQLPYNCHNIALKYSFSAMTTIIPYPTKLTYIYILGPANYLRHKPHTLLQ